MPKNFQTLRQKPRRPPADEASIMETYINICPLNLGSFSLKYYILYILKLPKLSGQTPNSCSFGHLQDASSYGCCGFSSFSSSKPSTSSLTKGFLYLSFLLSLL